MGLPPYIVDLNTDVHTHFSDEEDRLAYTAIMQYYSDTRNIDYTDYNGWIKLTGYKKGYNGSQDNLYVFLNPVEWKLYDSKFTFSNNDAMVREVQGRDVDPKTQSGYPATIFGMDAPNAENSSSSSFISVIQLSNNVPIYTPIPLISYADNDYQREVQAWSYQISDNAIDVIAKRGKVTGPSDSNFNNDVTFIVPQASNTTLKLPGGIDYGFVRLIKDGVVWKVDPNYQINLQQLGTFYASTTSIGDHSFTDGNPIYIEDNVALGISGNVSMSNNKVYLGKNAALVILPGGKLTANRVTFTSFDPNDDSRQFYGIDSQSSGNSFTSCTFIGGSTGFVKSSGGSDTTKHCAFRQNGYGIRVNGGSVYVYASDIGYNIRSGVMVNAGTLYSDELHTMLGNYGHIWSRTHITNNGEHGVYVGPSGTAWLRHTRVSENGSDEIKVNGGYLYAGQITNSWDNNRFTDDTNTGYYLNNIAYSSDGETYISRTAWAQQDYWGGGAPPDSKIWGDVRRDYYTTSDQTIYVDSLGTPPLPGQAKITPKALLTVSTAAQVVSNTINNFDSEELLQAKQRMNALQEAIAANPEDRWNIRRVQEWYHLARRYDINNQWGERSAVTLQINSWKDKMGTLLSDMPSDPGTGDATLNNEIATPDMQRPSLTQIKTNRLMGETALLLDIEQSIDDGNVTQAISQSHQALPRLQNTDSKAILYGYQLKAWQNMGRYDSAYVALERIKALKPDPGMTSEVSDEEFAPHEDWLLRQMKANNQSVPVLMESSGTEQVAQVQGTLPEKFELDSNYPNPFNPTTTIPFSLPQAAHVSVEVYNVAGQRVATLTNKDYQAGRYNVPFDAHGLASGLYLIRAYLGEKIFTRKMMLIK